MASAFDVADVFIQTANQSDDDSISNLKLNKLLYFAQGTYLARTGETLFDEPIEAWQMGPVVPAVYDKYKHFGKSPIPASAVSSESHEFSEDATDAILDVLREFGKYTGAALVSMTHKADTPCSETFYSNHSMSNTTKHQIPLQSIKEYFFRNPVPHFAEKIKVPVVSVLPNDWYDSSEDAEWESYL